MHIMSLWFYKSINEFVEEAIENLKPDLGESHDIQYWMDLIYIAKKKLIDYGNVDPGIAMQEIFSNIKISKEFSYWDDSCGGVMTTGHHRKVHIRFVECEEVIRACQEYLDKHKEVA